MYKIVSIRAKSLSKKEKMQVVMHFRLSPYSRQSRNTVSMHVSEGHAEMRRRRGQKNVFSQCVMSLDNGTQKDKDLSCGVFSTVR
ncbi:hypothetical protein D3C73_1494290 [compost metagenome]